MSAVRKLAALVVVVTFIVAVLEPWAGICRMQHHGEMDCCDDAATASVSLPAAPCCSVAGGTEERPPAAIVTARDEGRDASARTIASSPVAVTPVPPILEASLGASRPPTIARAGSSGPLLGLRTSLLL